MPIVLPGNKTMTLYLQPGGGYSTIAAPALAVSGAFTHGAELSVTTNGDVNFGADFTEMAFWDVDATLVDGVADTYPDGLAAGSDFVSASGSAYEGQAGSVKIAKSGHRHSRLSHHYYGECTGTSTKSVLARPRGRLGGSSPPKTPKRAFFWRSRNRYDVTLQKSAPISSITGTFQAGADFWTPGEAVTGTQGPSGNSPGSTFTGRFLYENGSRFYFLADAGQVVGSGELTTATIVGNTSGASVTFPALTISDIASASPKEFRLDQNGNNTATASVPNVTGFGSLHNRDLAIKYWDTSTSAVKYVPGTSSNNVDLATQGDLSDGRWHTWMVLSDEDAGTVQIWVDNQKIGTMNYPTSANATTDGFQMYDYGFDNTAHTHHYPEYGEFIGNDSHLFFVLSDSATAAGVDRMTMEPQYIKSVSGNVATITCYRGGFADETQLYLYAINSVTGEFVNSDGVTV